MWHAPGIRIALATLAAEVAGAPADAESFAIRGEFSAAGVTYVCLHANDANRSKWVLEDDMIAGWMVTEIVRGTPGRVALESAAGKKIELRLEPESFAVPVPPAIDPAWIRSTANPMHPHVAVIPDAWSLRWSTIPAAEKARIIEWYRNHGFDVQISPMNGGVTTTVGSAIRDDTHLEVHQRRAEAFEQSLAPLQRTAFDLLMAAHMRASQPVRIDTPPRPQSERVDPPSPEQWREFVATLSQDQAAEFNALWPWLTQTEEDVVPDPDAVVGEDTPTAEVHRALAALKCVRSYTWETISEWGAHERSIDPASPGEAALQPPAPMTDEWIARNRIDPRLRLSIGQVIRNELLHVQGMDGGTAMWTEAYVRPNRRSVINTPEGWLTLEECRQAQLSADTERIVFGGVELPRNMCYGLAAGAAYQPAPAEQIGWELAQVRFFRVVGDCHVAPLKQRRLHHPSDVENTEGTQTEPPSHGMVALRIIDGRIVEYHKVRRDVSKNRAGDRVVQVNSQHTRFTHHGTTSIEVPEVVRNKLSM